MHPGAVEEVVFELHGGAEADGFASVGRAVAVEQLLDDVDFGEVVAGGIHADPEAVAVAVGGVGEALSEPAVEAGAGGHGGEVLAHGAGGGGGEQEVGVFAGGGQGLDVVERDAEFGGGVFVQGALAEDAGEQASELAAGLPVGRVDHAEGVGAGVGVEVEVVLLCEEGVAVVGEAAVGQALHKGVCEAGFGEVEVVLPELLGESLFSHGVLQCVRCGRTCLAAEGVEHSLGGRRGFGVEFAGHAPGASGGESGEGGVAHGAGHGDGVARAGDGGVHEHGVDAEFEGDGDIGGGADAGVDNHGDVGALDD